MEPNTHLQISQHLCGTPEHLEQDQALVALETTPEMAVDERGLVHGGFVFGLADHAAMLAVNDPNVVLGSAEVRFLKPVATGERVVAEARVDAADRKKRLVEVSVRRGEEVICQGRFTCFVLERHVLD